MIPILVPTVLAKRPVTNRHLNSTNFTGYTPTAGVVTATPNYGLGADGTQTTTRWQVDTTNRLMRFVSNNTGIDATGTAYCISFFYRGTLSNIENVGARAGATKAPIDLGVAGPENLRRAYAPIISGANALAFIDLSVLANSDVEIWGIQTEKGRTTPGPYVPTGAAIATRWF